MKLLHKRYRIISHVADGGQGSLYVVFDQQAGNHKIAKIYRYKPSRFLTPFFDADVKDRFGGSLIEKLQQKLNWISPQQRLRSFLKYQYRQLSNLQHAGILFPEAIILEEPYCIIMKLVKGGSLRSILEDKNRLSLEQTGFYLAQLANILSYLHAQGVIHRDIKPENILIGSQGEVYLSDFDFAHFSSGWPGDYLLSSHYRNKGTGHYMAPEHLRGARPHPSMDIYSLATMVYEALSGQFPYGKRIEDRDDLNCFKPVDTLNKMQNTALQNALHPSRLKRTTSAIQFYRELFVI